MSKASKNGYAGENNRRRFVRNFITNKRQFYYDMTAKENGTLYAEPKKSGLELIRERLKNHPNLKP